PSSPSTHLKKIKTAELKLKNVNVEGAKNSLQHFCQVHGLNLPVYITRMVENSLFQVFNKNYFNEVLNFYQSDVRVGDKTFTSNQKFKNKKGAESNIAKEALEKLLKGGNQEKNSK